MLIYSNDMLKISNLTVFFPRETCYWGNKNSNLPLREIQTMIFSPYFLRKIEYFNSPIPLQ